eukprot:UN2372
MRSSPTRPPTFLPMRSLRPRALCVRTTSVTLRSLLPPEGDVMNDRRFLYFRFDLLKVRTLTKALAGMDPSLPLAEEVREASA